jgi:TM2 domain-containing membrane protein YozV
MSENVENKASNSVSKPTKVGAALFAFFLGGFGAHKFYLGYKKQGLIMLGVSVIGGVLIVPIVVIAVISLVEAILYFSKSDEDFENTYVVNKKFWF